MDPSHAKNIPDTIPSPIYFNSSHIYDEIYEDTLHMLLIDSASLNLVIHHIHMMPFYSVYPTTFYSFKRDFCFSSLFTGYIVAKTQANIYKLFQTNIMQYIPSSIELIHHTFNIYKIYIIVR
jgi:hypothetical protein